MYLRILFLGILILWGPRLFGQEKTYGHVQTNDNEILIGATIKIMDTNTGTITDVNGAFDLITQSSDKLIVSYVGFKSDTLFAAPGDTITISLLPNINELEEVVVKSESSMFDELSPRHNEVLLESELLKAACCNLSESFETNASVDVSFSDAVSGAKIIRMLGLDGRYVQINRENIPLVRGLTGRYGLGYIPGTWIQSIDVGKGAGSVVNGYESMSGQLNLEFKKPNFSEKIYINGYANSFGKVELNFNHARPLKNNWATAILSHVDYLNNEIDTNKDGFLDIPKSRQINFLNRYKYSGDRINSQIGIHVMRDEKAGGQTGFNFGDDHLTSSPYGFSNNTTRMEVFGKTGILFPATPYKGWGFIYSGSYQSIDAGFGRNLYKGSELTAYANIIYQNIFGNTFHQYKTGLSFLLDDFKEDYQDSTFNRNEIVPGAYFEYSYLPGDNLSIVIGNRVDYHNLFGIYYTPRVHTRLKISPITTLRLAVGKGYRTPNALTENMMFLISSRAMVVEEELDPETSWNFGGSIVLIQPVGGKDLQIITDYFYTSFTNQMVVDLQESSDQVRIYNLKGNSFAHSFQIEASVPLNKFFTAKAAYKYYDVQSFINDELQKVPFIATNRFFINLAYASKYDKWTADFTLNWIGRKKLPDTSDKPTNLMREDYSPDYFLANAQIARGFKWGRIYIGSENLLNFKQNDPIIDAENPFGNNFDASMVWGPVPGRLIYIGFRYKIKQE